MGTHTQKAVVPKTKTFFVLEKYVGDVKQKQEDVPELGELMRRLLVL